MLLGLLLDAAVIIGIIYLVNQGDQMDFGPAVFSALAIAIGNFACLYLLAPTLGIFALAPMFGIAILASWMISGRYAISWSTVRHGKAPSRGSRASPTGSDS